MMQEIILWAGGIILTGLMGLTGWFINYIFARLSSNEKIHMRILGECRKLDDKLESHKLYAAQTFATRMDLKETEAVIINHLVRIESKLDSKTGKELCAALRKSGRCNAKAD